MNYGLPNFSISNLVGGRRGFSTNNKNEEEKEDASSSSKELKTKEKKPRAPRQKKQAAATTSKEESTDGQNPEQTTSTEQTTATEPIIESVEPQQKAKTRKSKAAKESAEQQTESEVVKGKKSRKKGGVDKSKEALESETLIENESEKKESIRLYTLKFSTPILPYAKFPLTQNKYIQDFLRKYEEDKEQISKVIGVHFQSNNNDNAPGEVGIEIEITRRNNITIVESNSSKRFKIKGYDEVSNFCEAEEYKDEMMGMPLQSNSTTELDPKYKDLLLSDIFELKNIWFVFNKKINSLLAILPTEILNRYDMVIKTLQAPVFEIAKYPVEISFLDNFNEIVYKLAHYYFSIFQAIFTKDSDAVRPQIQEFLNIRDPNLRSRKVIYLFEELHSVIDKKLFYVQKTADEFKDRSKTAILESSYQKLLEDSKQTEKSKF